jgi:DNA-binding NarL/FixJ family response regulator
MDLWTGSANLHCGDEPLKRARIILVDDHPELLALTIGLLESEFEVLKTFASGTAMLEEVVQLAPDLLVMDITMPGLNGIEAAMKLRASGASAKVVFLTVHDDEDYVHSALAAGAQAYVTKHRLAFDLVPAMREALAGRRFVSGPLLPSHNPSRPVRS